MGCEDLQYIVDAKSSSLSDFSGQTLAIDAVFWFQRYYYARTLNEIPPANRVVDHTCDVSQAISLLLSIPDLFRNNITPIFIFDPMNRSRPSKAETTAQYLENAPDTSEPEKHFPFLQRPTELILKYLNIPYCEAPLFAEADASVFARSGLADAVVSNDYDTLLYGAPITLRKRRNNAMWEKIKLESVLIENQLTYREFLDVAILVGTDEVLGPYKGHIEEAVDKVQHVENLDEFETEQNRYLRGSSLQVTKPAPTFEELHELYLDPPVTEHSIRPKPTYPIPDFSSVAQFLYQELDQDAKMIETLLNPIKGTV